MKPANEAKLQSGIRIKLYTLACLLAIGFIAY